MTHRHTAGRVPLTTRTFRGSAVAVAVVLLIGGCASTTSGTPAAAGTVSASTDTDAPDPSTVGAETTASEPTSDEPASTAGPGTATDTTQSGTQQSSAQQTETPQPDMAEAYVYYVVDTRSGLRLSREIHDVPAGLGGPTEAIEAMIAGPQDPDYTTTWNPATEVRSATAEGGVISVDLSAEARTANVGSGGAALMVSQLVWTATEAFGMPDAAVQLTIDGAPAGELWGVLTWEEPIGRAAPEEVRTFVQIDTPREGAEVTSPVTITGDAAAFEANVPWRVLDDGGAEVASGFTMTTEGMRHAPFSFQVDLEPGSYTVEISEDDPSDGEGGTPGTDTRTITVLP